jgi:multidrug resistance efflux pump
MPVMTLANLDNLRIETTDLNEIDMIRIAPGDPVRISFDALGETVVDGKVLSIARQAAPGTGVNFTAVITMDAPPEGLRWGMSAFVDILPQD